jgi:hypothetical protein
MEPHNLLKLVEIHLGVDFRVILYGPIMEAQEKPLQLRNDAVLIITGIANEGTARVGVIARQILSVGVAAAPNLIAEQKRVAIIQGVIKSESQLARKGEAMMHKTSNTIHKDAP